MKLPNFFRFAPLNDLKQRMGLPVDAYGTSLVILSGLQSKSAFFLNQEKESKFHSIN
jgi:hypothetical protein